MKPPVVIVGIGQLGAVFATCFLRSGHPVIPVTRTMNPQEVAAVPELALVAVAEPDLDAALSGLPQVWRSRVGLLQNELLPYVWQDHGIEDPTVIAVWFEKKKGSDVRVIRPSRVSGPAAAITCSALQSSDIPTLQVSEPEMLFHLVAKNLYILAANIAGMERDGSIGALWDHDRPLVLAVAKEILDIQESLAGVGLDRDRLTADLAEAVAADPDHGATGRSAPARLERALRQADRFGLGVPLLRTIAATHLSAT